MKKIKVLHFPIRNTNGGITRSAIKYWKFIDKNKFQFDFATCSAKIDFEDEILRTGCKVHYVSCYAEVNPEQFFEEMKNILLEGEYDVVHLNTSWWKGTLAEQAAKEAGVKVILVHARSVYVDINDEEKRQNELLNHEKCKREFDSSLATHYMACSRAAADFLFGPQILREKITIFHNALDIKRYSFDRSQRSMMRKKLGLESKYVIGNIGRFVYAKNHKFLIDCFYEVVKEKPTAVLMLIGGGELEQEIREQAAECGIDDKVLFVGESDCVELYLQAMDVFAFPTRFEGLGNVLIEAQTAGLKCIASTNVPEETHITDNIIYLPLEKSQWVSEIMKYTEGYLRQDMSEKISEAGYDITKEIKVLERIYLEAL
ncbi:MAG: glycosyltransferase [Ruminococcus flavefaciens]|nr:glycosyltransferase [Ruminococcus flavefaciens]